jgi:hypothetical protein
MTSKSNDFRSLLSVFRDATAQTSSSESKVASQKAAAVEANIVNSSTANKQGDVEPTSTTDPSYSAAAIKEQIERVFRVNSIRKSTASAIRIDGKAGSSDRLDVRDTVHFAICATIVQDFPHEPLWKKWIEETGGDVNISDVAEDATSIHIKASAELYIHAKKPEGIQSEWLRSKTLPITHRPNWNDVRIIRAMLSLLDAALKDAKTTHVLFCTESCIPVVTLKEAALSILLNKPCPWEEKPDTTIQSERQSTLQRIDWDRSYIDCYDRNSSRCSRFDERELINTLLRLMLKSSQYMPTYYG